MEQKDFIILAPLKLFFVVVKVVVVVLIVCLLPLRRSKIFVLVFVVVVPEMMRVRIYLNMCTLSMCSPEKVNKKLTKEKVENL